MKSLLHIPSWKESQMFSHRHTGFSIFSTMEFNCFPDAQTKMFLLRTYLMPRVAFSAPILKTLKEIKPLLFVSTSKKAASLRGKVELKLGIVWFHWKRTEWFLHFDFDIVLEYHQNKENSSQYHHPNSHEWLRKWTEQWKLTQLFLRNFFHVHYASSKYMSIPYKSYIANNIGNSICIYDWDEGRNYISCIPYLHAEKYK